MKHLLLLVAALFYLNVFAVSSAQSLMYSSQKRSGIAVNNELLSKFYEKSKNFQLRKTVSENAFKSGRKENSTVAYVGPGPMNFRLNGAVVFDTNRDPETFGIYSFTVNKPIVRETITLMPRLSANGGVMYSDGKLFTYDYTIDYGYVYGSNYITYNAETGEEIEKKSMGYDIAEVYSNAALSCTQDPVTKVVYCCSYIYDSTTKEVNYSLATWDLEGNSKTQIAKLERPMQVMGCSSDGTLYGISGNTAAGSNNGGILYKIDKTNGTLTPVGDTGVKPKYFQSAVIDSRSDTFYWFANEEDESANLYIVDLSKGTVTLVDTLPYAEQVVGAYIPAPEAVDGAPSSALNLTATFENGSLSGTISFDVPDYSYDGEDLTGEISYRVMGNNESLANGMANSGTHVSCPVKVSASGIYRFEIILSNGEGDSPICKLELYVGKDIPMAVTDLNLSREGNVNTVTWRAPTATKNGGHMNEVDLRYTVIRMPGDVIVSLKNAETSFSETFDAEELSLYYYKIIPYNDDIEGESAMSNSVRIGEALLPPYEQTFDKKESIDLFTILDENKDNSTWSYATTGNVRYRFNMNNKADDWLITPPLRLKQGMTYELAFDAYALSSRSEEKMEVKMGKEATVKAMTTMVMQETTYTNTSREPKTEKYQIIPTEDGIYYIGFHAVSEANKGNLTVDNIKLGAGISASVPDSVTELSIVAGEKGNLLAQITFVTPVLNTNGEELSELTRIEIKRGIDMVKIFDNPKKGVLLSFDDMEVSVGLNSYTVIPYNSSGQGTALSRTVYIGTDKPQAPEKVIFEDRGNKQGVLTWDRVAYLGLNGGYVNPDDVVYTIYDANSKVIAEGIAGTEYELKNLNDEIPQVMTYFAVAAKNNIGESETASKSNALLVGPSYALPYTESFAKAAITNGPWTTELLSGERLDSEWKPRPDQSQDGDKGSADFAGYKEGASSRIYSPKLDISKAKNPRLNAWVLMPTGGAKLRVQVSVENKEWQELTVIENAEQWVRVNLDLSAYKSNNIRIAFVGECIKSYNFVYVDNVEVRDYFNNNLKITGITGSELIKFNEKAEYVVSVFNDGINVASGFSVSLVSQENETIATKEVEALESLNSVDILFEYVPSINKVGLNLGMKGIIDFSKDENISDNESETIVTVVKGTNYPIVTGLTGLIADNGVKLSWLMPSLSEPLVETVIDGFEGYEPFTIDGFGKWTVYDADGGETYVFGETQGWPNAGKPQAFMVFDVNSEYISGIGVDENFKMDKSHGAKLAVCWAANSTTTLVGHNDDWLISPLLSGLSQEISFQALRYLPDYGAESFEVYYSTTANTRECFVNKLAEVQSVPYTSWTTYTYSLPIGATYFAIRCISKEAFILGIDNVSYCPKPELPDNIKLESYRVYRNGMMLAEISVPEFTDETPEIGDNVYQVSALYNVGESILSESCTLITTEISDREMQDITIYGKERNIMISGGEGERIILTNTAGMLLFEGICSGEECLSVDSGIYLVRMAGRITKVIVK